MMKRNFVNERFVPAVAWPLVPMCAQCFYRLDITNSKVPVVHAADAIMDATRSRYVVADDSLPLILHYADGSLTGSFASVITWAHLPASRFYDLYYEPSQGGGLTPV